MTVDSPTLLAPAAEWAVDLMPHRRACACQATACRKPFVKGDLRAFRPSRSLAHRQYFCPSC
eukprot:12721559-Alexandrium_andersonii.AAC.1